MIVVAPRPLPVMLMDGSAPAGTAPSGGSSPARGTDENGLPAWMLSSPGQLLGQAGADLAANKVAGQATKALDALATVTAELPVVAVPLKVASESIKAFTQTVDAFVARGSANWLGTAASLAAMRSLRPTCGKLSADISELQRIGSATGPVDRRPE